MGGALDLSNPSSTDTWATINVKVVIFVTVGRNRNSSDKTKICVLIWSYIVRKLYTINSSFFEIVSLFMFEEEKRDL